ncbi:GTP-binding protein [Proteobacteria bacterium 005FR1]|nr:GTP-binding protein [Proteobacteria bacterium 005FR1]
MDNNRLNTLKLVIAGPVGAGKTTAIRSLADMEPVSTEMALTDGAMGEKTTTTVALDFSTVLLDDGTPLLVYGLPGQERFDHMRPIVISGAVGVIVLLDGSDAKVTTDCEHWLDAVRSIDPTLPVVVGVTKTDTTANFHMGQLREVVQRSGLPIPVFTVDARDREQTAHLVRALLVSLG